jgi:hypothetical protein
MQELMTYAGQLDCYNQSNEIISKFTGVDVSVIAGSSCDRYLWKPFRTASCRRTIIAGGRSNGTKAG